MKCPRCGLENPDDFKYCHECGTYLAPEFDAYNAKKHQNAYGSQFYGDSEFTVSTYAIHGNMQKISNYIFLATPNGVDISGDIQNLMDAFGSSDGAFTF